LKIRAFEVFGTVVDWGSRVIAEGEGLGKAKGFKLTGRRSLAHGDQFTVRA
jgi:hypothetical protein